jgi:L-alanine-DL-glutamate epimerase-like enolase superfamily enzyme
MKIVDVKTIRFKYMSKTVRDTDGHGHPGPEHEAVQTLLKIETDEGIDGYSFGGNPQIVANTIKPALLGEDPLYRERIWQDLKERQRLNLGTLSDRILCTVDMALWDLAGRLLNQPVHKLLGAFRNRVPAYASTMCGDELEGGLDTPEAYAEFALACKEKGYPAFKLHTWQPPISWAPDPKKDVAACKAVRDAVGEDMDLMLDPFHYYSREDSLYIGRALEELNYYWIEEPMDEHSISSYVWLTDQLSIPVVGPETAEGKMYTRAEWIRMHASDISRGGVGDLGGITPLVKTAHLCESFGVRMEVHGGGPGNLHVLCAMGFPGEYYERGLLHPFIDYDVPPAWLNELPDPMDEQGFVHVSEKPGLGLDINFDYIESNLVD